MLLTKYLLRRRIDGGYSRSMIMLRTHEFLAREDGQDLVEYSLLLAFIMFTIIGLTLGFSASIAGIVGVSSSQIANANTMVS